MKNISNKFAFWVALGRIGSMLVVFAMPLFLTRVLNRSDYGTFSQFFTLYSALYVILGCGVHASLFFFYPTASKSDRDKYATNALISLLLLTLISYSVLNISFIQNLFLGDSELSQFKVEIILCIVLAIPTNMIGPLYTVSEDKIGALIIPSCAAIIRIGVIVVIASLVKDLFFVFWGLVFYQIFILFFILFYTFRKHCFSFDGKLLKAQLAYSIPFGGMVALQLLSNYFDKIVSIHFIPPLQYAIYSVAFLSIPGINQIYDSLCQVNIVNMTKCYHENNKNMVVELYKDFVTRMLSFSVPIILAVVLFANEIVSFLYPDNYQSAANFFRIYSLTFITAMFGAGTILRAVNKTSLSLKAYLITCIVGLPITYWLIKQWGIHGAIVSAVINILLPRVLQMGCEMYVTKSSFRHFLPCKNIFSILFFSGLFLLPLVLAEYLCSLSIVHCVVLSLVYVIACYIEFINKNVFIVNKNWIEMTIKKFIVMKKFN